MLLRLVGSDTGHVSWMMGKAAFRQDLIDIGDGINEEIGEQIATEWPAILYTI